MTFLRNLFRKPPPAPYTHFPHPHGGQIYAGKRLVAEHIRSNKEGEVMLTGLIGTQKLFWGPYDYEEYEGAMNIYHNGTFVATVHGGIAYALPMTSALNEWSETQ